MRQSTDPKTKAPETAGPEKNMIEVVIGGEVVALMGAESEEYFQKIARYIDKKLTEIMREKKSLGVNSFMKTLLIAVNIADDLFKQKEITEKLEAELLAAGGELEKTRHEIGILTERMNAAVLAEAAAKEKTMEMEKVKDRNMEDLEEKIRTLQAEISSLKDELAEYEELFASDSQPQPKPSVLR